MHRGYRTEAGERRCARTSRPASCCCAPAGPGCAPAARLLLDPLCGSTGHALVIELALDPRGAGLARGYFGFLGWRGHDAALWARLVDEARAAAPRRRAARGTDRDAAVLRSAVANAQRAGVADQVRFEALPLAAARPLDAAPGLVVTSPPYGERLGDDAAAREVHRGSAAFHQLASRHPPAGCPARCASCSCA
ncbi:MAG: hypothetical protein U1F67_00850 [Rubrivivax sp.]